MSRRWELATAPPARRALAERLPPQVAAAACDFATGPLLDNPRRVGKALRGTLAGVYSARLGSEWRILYELDEVRHVVILLDIQHRSTAYRSR